MDMGEGEGIKIVLIGNCQARPIADFLQLRLQNVAVDVVGAHLYFGNEISRKSEEDFEAKVRKANLIFAMPLSEKYGKISASGLKSEMDRESIVFFPNIYFSGLHPDAIYLGELGSRLKGPIGDYHSKVALLGFLLGRSPIDTVLMYNEHTYHRLDFFSEVNRSLNELRRREQEVDVGVATIIENSLKDAPCFLTVNHPTAFLFVKFVDELIRFLELKNILKSAYPPLDHHLMQNPLSEAAVFPVYDEVAKFHRLNYSGGYTFKPPRNEKTATLISLSRLVEMEFEAFKSVPRRDIFKSIIASQLLEKWEG